MDLKEVAAKVVEFLLTDDAPVENVYEASVHVPRRGRIWVAAFTGPEGGQVWRSTGTEDREEALRIAKGWEAAARAERTKRGQTTQKLGRASGYGIGDGLLTQQEVAQILGMTERGVRAAEKRAFQKLRKHPLLRRAWQQHQTGGVEEDQAG